LQPGGRGGRGGGFGGFGGGGFGGGGFGGGGGLMLLADENVRKDLGITDDQVKKMEAFQAKVREEMGQVFQGLRDLSDEERTAKFAEIQKKMTDMSTAAEKEILLPKQVDRLKQISYQSRLNRGGTVDALASDDIAKELGITEAQKDERKDDQASRRSPAKDSQRSDRRAASQDQEAHWRTDHLRTVPIWWRSRWRRRTWRCRRTSRWRTPPQPSG